MFPSIPRKASTRVQQGRLDIDQRSSGFQGWIDAVGLKTGEAAVRIKPFLWKKGGAARVEYEADRLSTWNSHVAFVAKSSRRGLSAWGKMEVT